MCAGVQIYPFHTSNTSLPGLPWDDLLRVGYTGPQELHKAAAIMLSEPHFTQASYELATLLLSFFSSQGSLSLS